MIKMKAIRPAPFRAQEFDRFYVEALMDTIGDADKEFRKTYATWKKHPKWVRKTRKVPEGWLGEIYTESEIYQYVSRGTRGPYLIPKNRPGLLVFPSTYIAKTHPGVLGSGAGGASGDKVFVFGQVEHPGIKARNFEGLVAAIIGPVFFKRAREATSKAAAASGHRI